MKYERFLNKNCKLTYQSGFILDGKVIEADDNGIVFKTPQSISFISWVSIRDIKLVGD